MISTRTAPTCRDLAAGYQHLVYSRYDAQAGWISATRDEFLATSNPSMPVTFYVHGNALRESMAIRGAIRAREHLGGGAPFRLVLWSWPSAYIAGTPIRENVRIKAQRSEAQGYYLARLITEMDEGIPLSLVGHSFGARTVTASLQGLASGRVAGCELPSPASNSRPRRIQAALLAAAQDARSLGPGGRHQLAVTQVERLLITVNSRDRILRAYQRMVGFPVLGLDGPSGLPVSSDVRAQIVMMDVADEAGKRHLWVTYTDRPAVAAQIRPFFRYSHGAAMD